MIDILKLEEGDTIRITGTILYIANTYVDIGFPDMETIRLTESELRECNAELVEPEPDLTQEKRQEEQREYKAELKTDLDEAGE